MILTTFRSLAIKIKMIVLKEFNIRLFSGSFLPETPKKKVTFKCCLLLVVVVFVVVVIVVVVFVVVFVVVVVIAVVVVTVFFFYCFCSCHVIKIGPF